MKFPRTQKTLRSQFNAAPVAAVLFCLLIFLLIGSLLPIGGLRMNLTPPSANDLPGADGPVVALAVDSQNRLYFENQIVSEAALKTSLAATTKGAREPLTLIIHADKSVTYEELARLALLAREPQIGITNIVLATLPSSIGPAKQP